MKPLSEIAERLGLSADDWEAWGPGRAKVTTDAATRGPRSGAPGRLVLVSAMNPTRFGAGKTTTSIGLAQGLAQRGKRSAVCLREPSLGPIFGRKGGAVGGGASRVHPANAINMHFTGDLHAITSAHNLLAALLDNHLHFRGSPTVPPARVSWPRVMDMCDRALRHTVVGLDAKNGPVRESGFQITAASEVMGVLCLATSAD
ncbi:MAG: formate--tetrahydrofolate ligase, partial [Myxococcota bacterium]